MLIGLDGRSAFRIVGLSACEIAVSLLSGFGLSISSIIDAADTAAAAAAAAITVLMLSPAYIDRVNCFKIRH